MKRCTIDLCLTPFRLALVMTSSSSFRLLFARSSILTSTMQPSTVHKQATSHMMLLSTCSWADEAEYTNSAGLAYAMAPVLSLRVGMRIPVRLHPTTTHKHHFQAQQGMLTS